MIRLSAQNLYGANTVSRLQDGGSTAAARQAEPKKGDSVELGGGDRNEDKNIMTSAQIRKVKDERELEARQKIQDGDRRFEFDSAIKALPRNSQGEVRPDLLVGNTQRASLTQAVDRLMMEGLGSTAEVAFEKAVNSLFAEYADDLGLDEAEIARAKELMLTEVRQAVKDAAEVRPWTPDAQSKEIPQDLESAIEKLQERILDRRQFMMEASGDLSRVLAELTVDAQHGGEEAVTALGDFLGRFGGALRSRSNLDLRDGARELMLDPNAEVSANSDGLEWGEAFLDYLKAA